MDQSLPPLDTVDLGRVARLVRPFETLEMTAVPRPCGGWAIGYGHVRSARAGVQVTREEAEALLLYDLHHTAKVVRSALYAPVNRNQLEALIAFAFHIGTERFLTSTTLQRFNAGDSFGAAQALERWCCAEFGTEVQVVDALVRRRAAEKAHFLTPPEGFPKASRARLRPQVEASSADLSEGTPVAPSATLAAAHSVSARLRALVPDQPADLEPELTRPTELRSATFEPAPAPHAAPVDVTPTDVPTSVAAIYSLAEPLAEPQQTELEPAYGPEPAPVDVSGPEAVVPLELEIPPPPMPSAAEPTYALHPTPPERDPFAQGPLEAAAIEAPPPETLALEETSALSGLLRAKADARVDTPSRPESLKTSGPRGALPKAFWLRTPKSWLWAALVIGGMIFVWSIWSIFKTAPGPINFIAGLVGIAVMAAPAYLLLGARERSAR